MTCSSRSPAKASPESFPNPNPNLARARSLSAPSYFTEHLRKTGKDPLPIVGHELPSKSCLLYTSDAADEDSPV